MPAAEESAKLTIDSHKQPLTEEMSNLELLDRAATSATCQMLGAAGSSLVGAGAVSLWAAGVGFAPLAAGGVSLLAANYLCPDMPLGGDPPDPGIDGCQQISDGGYGQLEMTEDGVNWGSLDAGGYGDKATQIVSTDIGDPEPGRGYPVFVTFDALPNATNYKWTAGFYPSNEAAQRVKFRITPTVGTCDKESDGTNPIPPEALQPIQYTDNITNCNYTLTLQGFAQESQDGPPNPVWQIESSDAVTFAGGRMGGCNFPPTIYMPQPGGGGGGGGITIPVPPGGPFPPGPDGLPWWAGPLIAALGGAAANQLADAINELLAPYLEESEFTLLAPCNKNPDGTQSKRTWLFPAQREPERLLTHQIALMEIMQQHLDWKTPICDETTIPEGDFRTISFRSDETSPFGKSRLRKRFRYRSVSGNDLNAVVDHWKDFTFEGGPYRVRWIGGSWGAPEVWAASEAEGKRVIQHAAAEAGFDPFESGRWSTRVSSSARRGVQCTVRVDTTGGYYWITARDGSDQRPIVALT